ncbi:hypothetical protein [Mesorhizobium helmanticense]|uniref:Uncharacterized protein n=1 Tax=Mesorhizobium helmanticense TaxID=1776423 RepID=A0A2T4J180_9HYPH|nr:hypothetical protein [Mesorhizobium helmanticense]PTE11649.1 hypothetical protein C9427_05425 [Mesorhizobium helmanticense]
MDTQGTETWQFEIGSWITHRDQPMPSLVMTRQRAGRLGELYGVRSFALVDPNRDRMILADSIKPIDDAAKAICLAHQSGLA